MRNTTGWQTFRDRHGHGKPTAPSTAKLKAASESNAPRGTNRSVFQKRHERPECKEPGAEEPECTGAHEDSEHRATPQSGRAVAFETRSQGVPLPTCHYIHRRG